MTLRLAHASLATVEELFEFKASGFELPEFPGHTGDQWGIKAHNRPWVAANGQWAAGQRIVEVGGAYSTLPEHLAAVHGLEAWVADDFGAGDGDERWSRWGDPRELARDHPDVNYEFTNLGPARPFPDAHFDRIFTVSTLEHIAEDQREAVLADMNRCTAPGGIQLHTIDIPVPLPAVAVDVARLQRRRPRRAATADPRGIMAWFQAFADSGVRIDVEAPSSLELLNRRVLVESPDVVYRFYPPNDAPKKYRPAASLLLVIRDDGPTPDAPE